MRTLCFCARSDIQVWKLDDTASMDYMAACGTCGAWSDVTTLTAITLVKMGAVNRSRKDVG